MDTDRYRFQSEKQVSSRKSKTSHRLIIIAIWLVIGGGFVREVLGQTEILSLGFYTFHSVDLGVIFTFLAIAFNVRREDISLQPYFFPVIIMTLLVLVNFLRGLAIDPGPALLNGRATLGMVAILMLALVAPADPLVIRAVRRALVIMATLLSGLILIRLASYPSLFMTVDVPDELINDGGRALSAQGAFLMVVTSGLLTSELFVRHRIGFDRLTIAAVALPIFILLTRQGTATVAEIVLLGIILFFQRGNSQGIRIFFGALGAIGVLLLLMIYLPTLRESADVIQRTNNLGTRKEVWSSLLAIWPSQPIFTQLFGYPNGQQLPLLIFLGGSYQHWGNGIHSMYYGALPMMGYVGAAAYVVTLAMLFWETLPGSLRKSNPLPTSMLGLCVATAIFSYSYEIRNEATLGLFLVILMLRATRDMQRREI